MTQHAHLIPADGWVSYYSSLQKRTLSGNPIVLIILFW